MSYANGDLKRVVPCSHGCATDDSWCQIDSVEVAIADARDGYAIRTPAVYLEHSCEEWVIGGPAEIRALIHDLTAALAVLEGA